MRLEWMKYAVFTHTCLSDFNVDLTFIGYNQYTYGSKNLKYHKTANLW